MNRYFDDFDMSMLVPVDSSAVEDALNNPDRTVSELLLLYFVCLSRDPDGVGLDESTDRIAQTISDLADDGDEEAMMAMVAISALSSEHAAESDVIVGVAMLHAVASRPLLSSVVSGDLDHDTAAGALGVINVLSNELLGDVLDLDDLDDLELDDLDLSELASELGVSEFDLDFDGELNDR